MKSLTKKFDAILKLAESAEPGSIIHVDVKHDPGCPALVTHNLLDCTCDPVIRGGGNYGRNTEAAAGGDDQPAGDRVHRFFEGRGSCAPGDDGARGQGQTKGK